MTGPIIPDSAIITATSDVLATDFGDETVILNLEDGVYYGLDDVGTRIWSLIKEPVTVADIRDVLVSEFDVEPARCEQDIRALVRELATRGLVEIRLQP